MVMMPLGRLLIVDDEYELMSGLCEMLGEAGYSTMGFSTAQEALEALKAQEFDLLMTDLMMPGMDGIQLIDEAQQLDSRLVCLVMTGYGTVETAVEAMKGGAFDFVTKPFSVKSLLPVLMRAMHVRALKLENCQLREAATLYELSQAIAFTFDMRAILNKVADAAVQQCDADEASIMLPLPASGELYVAIARGEQRDFLIGARTSLDQGIAGWVAQHQQPVLLDGEVNDPRFKPVKSRPEIKASLSVPMLVGGKFVGVLNLNSTKRQRAFTIGQVKAVNILTSMAASALESVYLFQQTKAAEEQYRGIFENSTEGIFRSTPDGQIILANPALARMLGYDTPAALTDAVQQLATEVYVDPGARDAFIAALQAHGEARNVEVRLFRQDRSIFWALLNGRVGREAPGMPLYFEGTITDINERKLAEEALCAREEELAAIYANAPVMLLLIDKERRVRKANRAAMIAIGSDAEALFGVRGGEALRCVYAFTNSQGCGFSSHCEQCSMKQIVINTLATGQGADRVEASVVLDKLDSPVEATFLVSTALLNSQDDPQVLVALQDITKRKNVEQALSESEQRFRELLSQLGESFDGIVQALAATNEWRDPYTAGHQRRVAQLAVAITEQLGGSPEDCRKMRVAGLLHDLGKIVVPSEILSKPGKLLTPEFDLIKLHPQVGYDILKSINFAWPIAEIVRQHHFRIDGSGYPGAIAPEELLFEAKILAVADVMEAMTSHRPYRPALGNDAGIGEIRRGAGSHYDRNVVDACIKVYEHGTWGEQA